MASTEMLQKRIESFTQKIEKANNTIAKHNKTIDKKVAELKKKYNFEYSDERIYSNELVAMGYSQDDAWNMYWLMCDIENAKDSIRDRERDIKSYKESLDKYALALQVETNKSESRNIQVIIDFLKDWKSRVYDYIVNSENGLIAYHKDRDYVMSLYPRELGIDYSWEWSSDETKRLRYKEASDAYSKAKKEFDIACSGRKERVENSSGSFRYSEYKKVETGKYEWLKHYLRGSLEEDLAYLDKLLSQEANAKYDDLVNRVCAVVGTIVDASNLSIGRKGDLNGFIVGTDGKASIETIGAGGYNIQCYHFRTLIHKINK